MAKITRLALASIVLWACGVGAAEIKVMTSGGFAAAHADLVPSYEKLTGDKIVTILGS